MQIRVPKENSYYVESGGYAFGPFHDSGNAFDETPDDDVNLFSQGSGLYGENSVTHSKSRASLTINSLIAGDDIRPYKRTDWRQTQTHEVLLFRHKGSGNWYPTRLSALVGGSDTEDTSTKTWPVRLSRFAFKGNSFFEATFSISKDWKFPMDISVHVTETVVTPIKLSSGGYDPSQVRRQDFWSWPKGRASSREDAVAWFLSLDITIERGQPMMAHTVPKLFSRHPYKADVESAKRWYRKFSAELVHAEPTLPDTQLFGDLVQVACENVNPNTINAIAFIKDLKDVKSLIPKLRGLSKVSTHASNYLGVEYGILPTIDDLKSIWASFSTPYFFDRNGFQRASAYDTAAAMSDTTIDGSRVETVVNLTRRVHLAVNTNDTGLDALVERMRKIGIFPSLTNLWDLIPYSFVLDWFVDVGAVLERIDTRHQLLNLDIPYCILSTKSVTTRAVVSQKDGLFLHMSSTYYNRSVQESVPQPRIFSENRVTAQNHWIEGSALILSRTKN